MTTLVERWWPKTHSFHLRTGEWTVTLQDVEVLLGLPVDGEPVIWRSSEDWGPLCERLLGIVLVLGVDRIGGKIMMTWLREHFIGHLAAGYTKEDVRQQARGYILQLIGGVLMSNHSGCQSGKQNVGGIFILLQLWAWERSPFVAPRCLGTRERPPGSHLVARWDDHFHSPDLATHVVGYYRNYFDMQRLDEVDPLHKPAIEVEDVAAQEPVDPFIHNDAIPDTVDAETTSALQDGDGGFYVFLLYGTFRGCAKLPIHTYVSKHFSAADSH
ncbi:hypothetical protein RHSIM_Rhsim03G0242100 [Rhododendron simsii]|uniref:Aminotransferase-like plant mobile domain-containing protein n=1 Tax=Rhododendron simsii TaxID=118357 RepID=A0A834H6W0_RHOSS|nr:hypothetical protein RHSIM_Rhsim03G0242100 [Rhododendron simsii]